METFSALLVLCVGIHWSPVNSPHKGQCRGALKFSFVCAWINGWENSRKAGNVRRHRPHYDVIVMRSHWDITSSWPVWWIQPRVWFQVIILLQLIMRPQGTGKCLQYRISPESQIKTSRHRQQHPFWLRNLFEILHRARQYHCRALCNISEQLDNWDIRYGKTGYRGILVSCAFRGDIWYCNRIHDCISHVVVSG